MDANPPTTPITRQTAFLLSDEQESALVELFTYHAPTPEQQEWYAMINDAAYAFARVVLAVTPKGPDQSAAIRQIREARMTANAAIACRGAKLP